MMAKEFVLTEKMKKKFPFAADLIEFVNTLEEDSVEDLVAALDFYLATCERMAVYTFLKMTAEIYAPDDEDEEEESEKSLPA